MYYFINNTHPEWHAILETALGSMDKCYLTKLKHSSTWVPGIDAMLACFSKPLTKLRYILLGESPYPRPESANGYAFWDAHVHEIWSKNGLSKEVNRATSLRNFIKMLLAARKDLGCDISQEAIAKLDKSHYWQTATQLFHTLINKGFLLLNASLAYGDFPKHYHAKHWQPFITSILTQLYTLQQTPQLLLFGRIAEKVPKVELFTCLITEHPYNLSFITNPNVLAFFKPLDLLNRHDE